MDAASWADRRRPVRIISAALWYPICEEKRASATGGKQPTVISGVANRLSSVASTRSQDEASSQPPPRQTPSTTATVG